MTKEQKELCEKNHNLIYLLIHRYNLDMDDYYDLLAIGLCKASITYDETKGFTFSSYATNVMYNEVKNLYKKLNCKKVIPMNKILHYDCMTTTSDEDDDEYSMDICDNKINIEDEVISCIYLEEVISHFSPIERKIFDIYINDDTITQKEIAMRLGCSRQLVSKIKIQICNKLRYGYK